ncbi:hypothetical protein Y694_04741 [Methylibium sp. T29-B]|nr:hypothetical protein Y694_04741 [Methylibium sp. T29-B]
MAAISADGAASDSAQGQVTIRMDTATHTARDGSTCIHTPKAAAASSSTPPTNGAATRSAQRTVDGRSVSARCISATIC